MRSGLRGRIFQPFSPPASMGGARPSQTTNSEQRLLLHGRSQTRLLAELPFLHHGRAQALRGGHLVRPRVASGDHLQIAWDPLTNTAGLAKDKRRTDDTNIALALADGKPSPLFYYGPDRDIFRKSQYAVKRSEKDKTTYYELKIPLSSLGIRYEEKRVFGFAAVVFDDDSNTRWDYYMNCFPGITRGNDPSLYGQFVLE